MAPLPCPIWDPVPFCCLVEHEVNGVRDSIPLRSALFTGAVHLGDVFLLQVLGPGAGPGRVTGSVQVSTWLLELWIRKQSTLTKFELKFKLPEKSWLYSHWISHKRPVIPQAVALKLEWPSSESPGGHVKRDFGACPRGSATRGLELVRELSFLTGC